MDRQPKHFNTIKVPATVHSQIRYLERVCLQLGAATDPEKIGELFSLLSYARKFLYEEIEARCEEQTDETLAILRFT